MDALRAAGANLVSFGEDCVEAEMKAREVAGQQGMTYVSPYNDLQVNPLQYVLHMLTQVL